MKWEEEVIKEPPKTTALSGRLVYVSLTVELASIMNNLKCYFSIIIIIIDHARISVL